MRCDHRRASARIRIDGSPGGQWTNPVEDTVSLFKLPSVVFGVAWADAIAVGVVFHVNSAPRFSAAFALGEFPSCDDTNLLHWIAIAFAMPG